VLIVLIFRYDNDGFENIMIGCDEVKSSDNGVNATLKSLGIDFDLHGNTLPKVFVEKMLETMKRHATEYAQEKEREEIVCRLLASEMTVDEISLRLKIRADEIRTIESNNAKTKIPEYARTYKARAKSRAKAKK